MLILKDLFVNVCIFVTILFVGSLIFKDSGIGSLAPLKTKILSGILSGILGVILMIFSIKVTPSVIIDLRHLSLIFSAVYLGGTATLISGVIMTLFRVFVYGLSEMSIMVGVIIMIATIGSAFIGKLKISKKFKWILLVLYNTFIFSISIFIATNNIENISMILICYWIGSIASSVLVYYYTQYLWDFYTILKKLKAEATTDFLTGLNNTRKFDIVYNEIINRVKTNKEKISMVMLDIDFFKRVNDNFGHSAGDEVLKELGNILKASVRGIDVVARIGGEEFCMLLQDCGLKEAYEITEGIRKQIEGHTFILPYGVKIDITISAGIASFPESTNDIDGIKELADNQLYNAKRSGRNRVCVQGKYEI